MYPHIIFPNVNFMRPFSFPPTWKLEDVSLGMMIHMAMLEVHSCFINNLVDDGIRLMSSH